jgi:hypothetical protein
MDAKEIAARSAVAAIESGMVVGLGTGSTALKAVHALAERIRNEGLRVVGVPTSIAKAEIAPKELQSSPRSPPTGPRPRLDGADQVDAHLCCIKGYGGALLREKIAARCAQRFLVMIDPTKLTTVPTSRCRSRCCRSAQARASGRWAASPATRRGGEYRQRQPDFDVDSAASTRRVGAAHRRHPGPFVDVVSNASASWWRARRAAGAS